MSALGAEEVGLPVEVGVGAAEVGEGTGAGRGIECRQVAGGLELLGLPGLERRGRGQVVDEMDPRYFPGRAVPEALVRDQLGDQVGDARPADLGQLRRAGAAQVEQAMLVELEGVVFDHGHQGVGRRHPQDVIAASVLVQPKLQAVIVRLAP